MAGPLLSGPLPAWAALYVNVLTFVGTGLLVLIPQSIGQLIAQGMLLVALVLALLANPGMVVRPNIFLTLLSAMAVLALMASIHNEFIVRLDVPCHSFDSLRRRPVAAYAVVGQTRSAPASGTPALPAGHHRFGVARSVTGSWCGVLDLRSARRRALADPTAPGRTLCGRPVRMHRHPLVLRGSKPVEAWRSPSSAAGAAVVATHTRTALLGVVLGLIVAGASLFVGYARVRRTGAVVVLTSVAAWIVFSPLIVSWLARGQSEQDLTQLTGRTKVWSALAQQQFTTMQQLFGTGLGNKSFNGLPIDSNWVATRFELGRVGVALVVAILLVLLLSAVTRPAGPNRAIALFIVVYCVTASFTETGLGDASPYLLDLAVAASLLVSPPRFTGRRRIVDRHVPAAPDRAT